MRSIPATQSRLESLFFIILNLNLKIARGSHQTWYFPIYTPFIVVAAQDIITRLLTLFLNTTDIPRHFF